MTRGRLDCARHRGVRLSALGQKRTIFTAPFYDCFAPESGHLSAWGGRNYFGYTPLIKTHYRVEKELSPRIGTFGQTGTLGDLIDRLLPALLKLFHGLQRGLAVSGDLG